MQLESLNYWNGYVMLVSVGTLLYITMMHMLPEVYPMHHTDDNHSHECDQPDQQIREEQSDD